MMEYTEAETLLGPGEKGMFIFTRGDDLEMRPDGTGSSGYWKINPRREVDRVVIYLRDPERPDLNELHIAEFAGLVGPRHDGRYLVQLRAAKSVGFTRLPWSKFARTGMGPIRYLTRES